VSLRRKLILLLSAFAGFAVLAAAGTIFAVHRQLDRALRHFEKATAQTLEVDRIRYALKSQVLHLREVVRGRREAIQPYFSAREEFSSRVGQFARFGAETAGAPRAEELRRMVAEFEAAFQNCLTALQRGETKTAEDLLSDGIELRLASRLDASLSELKASLETDRAQATAELGATSTRTLIFTGLISGLSIGLVIAGATLIRRWLIQPIATLEIAAGRFSEGDFAYRVSATGRDELGGLGRTLNQMAQRVSDAHATLHDSEMKYRNLFRNLRDAVVICDEGGRVVEYHDSDTHLLGVEGSEHKGRHFLDVWPEWRQVSTDWVLTFGAVITAGKRFRFNDVGIPRAEWDSEGTVFADFLVYRVEIGERRFAAIVARDVTESSRLQTRLRRAETLEAIGALAGGLAHDFNNLLSAVTGSLTMLATQVTDEQQAERIRSALRACRQAAGLSRKLLNFATTAHGDPQIFRLADMVQMILNSLDVTYFEGVAVEKNLGDPVAVRMDPDQFTQVVLNLLRNSCDAMPQGGTIRIDVGSAVDRDMDEGTPPQTYAVLTVEDSGHGMPQDVLKRVFEPLFTTRSRTGGRARGLGMAVVYTAIKNARGFVRIQSELKVGTIVRVFLPAPSEPANHADDPEACETVENGDGRAETSPMAEFDRLARPESAPDGRTPAK